MTDQKDLDWWLAKAATLEWTWAKTYADSAPHWYVVDGRTEGMNTEDYARAGRVIRRFGKPGKFYEHTNIYLVDEEGGYKYWFMPGDDIDYDATLINRATLDKTYGRQNAVDTTSQHDSMYDTIGPDYDAMWTKPEDLEENEAVQKLVREHFGAYAPTTLDIGCGTGLLLDLGITSPALYTGVDPSQGMLNELVLKHPKVKELHALTAEEWMARHRPKPRSYELVAALFAPVSYMTPEGIRQLATLSSSMTLLMNYDGKWLPEYYKGVEPETVGPARKATRDLLHHYNGFPLTIGNFEVTVLEHS